jgi:hypothetical protein
MVLLRRLREVRPVERAFVRIEVAPDLDGTVVDPSTADRGHADAIERVTASGRVNGD